MYLGRGEWSAFIKGKVLFESPLPPGGVSLQLIPGTLVKRDTTSKLTKVSLGCRVRFLVISTNTWCWVRPTRGRRILAMYRAVLYVGDPLEATMGAEKNIRFVDLRLSEEPGSWWPRSSEVSVELDGKGIMLFVERIKLQWLYCFNHSHFGWHFIMSRLTFRSFQNLLSDPWTCLVLAQTDCEFWTPVRLSHWDCP